MLMRYKTIIFDEESSIENYGAWNSDRDYDVLNYAFSNKKRIRKIFEDILGFLSFLKIFEDFWHLILSKWAHAVLV